MLVTLMLRILQPWGGEKVTYSNINGIRSKPTISKLYFFLVQQLQDCYQPLPIFLSYYKIDSDRFCSIFRWFYGGAGP